MQRIISIALIVLLCSNMIVLATDDSTQEGIYFTTQEVPQEVTKYAQQNLTCVINGFCKNIYDVKLSPGFTVYNTSDDLFYFIVSEGNKMKGVYRVYNTEQGLSGIYADGGDIIDGLSKIVTMSTSKEPITIVSGDYGDLYAIHESNVYTLLNDYMNKVTKINLKRAKEFKQIEPVNILENIDFAIPLMTKGYGTSKTLSLDLLETQNGNQWCSAYVTASIMRYVKNESIAEHSATGIMSYFYHNMPYSTLLQTKLGNANVINYAELHDIYPTRANGMRTFSQNMTEIDNDRPVLFKMQRTDANGNHFYHDIALRGYSAEYTAVYYVWNPWYNFYESFAVGSNYYPANSTRVYTYYDTVYGWE